MDLRRSGSDGAGLGRHGWRRPTRPGPNSRDASFSRAEHCLTANPRTAPASTLDRSRGDLMRTKEHVKREILAAIDRRADQIVGLGERIRRAPELGFKEVKTARLVEEAFAGLGLAPKTGLALTAVRAEARGSADGPTLALLGELDGLVVSGHSLADPATGAAHACGHNAQIAGLLGAAMGLLDAKAMEALSGRAVFFAVPAEEYGDVEWRADQAQQGRLEFLSGKAELLKLGHFDDVDLAMMIHTTARPQDGKAGVPASNNGCIVKTVRYVGKAAHAGSAPHRGVNAL